MRRTLLALLFAATSGLIAGPAFAQVAADRSVGVVLQGANTEGAHAAEQYWGMIADALRKDPAIRVPEKATMEPLVGKTITPQEAGAAMKVRFVLTGGVSAGSHAFKFELKMFDAKDGKQLWATTFQSDEDNILIAPTEIGSAAITQLKGFTL